VPLVPPDRHFFRRISARLSNGRTYSRREAFARLRGWSVCSAVKREQPGVWRLTRINITVLSRCSSGSPAKLPDKISADRPAREPDKQLHTNQYRRTLAPSHHRRLLDCILLHFAGTRLVWACFVTVCLGWHSRVQSCSVILAGPSLPHPFHVRLQGLECTSPVRPRVVNTPRVTQKAKFHILSLIRHAMQAEESSRAGFQPAFGPRLARRPKNNRKPLQKAVRAKARPCSQHQGAAAAGRVGSSDLSNKPTAPAPAAWPAELPRTLESGSFWPHRTTDSLVRTSTTVTTTATTVRQSLLRVVSETLRRTAGFARCGFAAGCDDPD
jgi:hypothetical protein